MSTYYAIGCNTCKVYLNMAGYGDSSLDRNILQFTRDHLDHSVTLVSDVASDEAYDTITSYEKVESRYNQYFETRAILIEDDKKITLNNVPSEFITEASLLALQKYGWIRVRHPSNLPLDDEPRTEISFDSLIKELEVRVDDPE